MRIRVGQGFDAHAFAAGDGIVIGGIRIPHDRGIAATSDGDVALHALCDALLGAVALGDLGEFFPSGEHAWDGADSRDLLRRVVGRVEDDGYAVVNTDLTVICQAPRLAPHRDAMRKSIAELLRTNVSQVSVKFTTTDKLGFTGNGEGLAALAVALVAQE